MSTRAKNLARFRDRRIERDEEACLQCDNAPHGICGYHIEEERKAGKEVQASEEGTWDPNPDSE